MLKIRILLFSLKVNMDPVAYYKLRIIVMYPEADSAYHGLSLGS